MAEHKGKSIKNLIALITSLVLVFGLVPISAFAGEGTANESEGLTSRGLRVGTPAVTSTANRAVGSLYQVEFTRTDNNLSYIYMGQGPVKLSGIFRMIGLKDKIANRAPTFDPDDGFSCEQDGTDYKISYTGDPSTGNWSRTMTVVVGGKEYKVVLKYAAQSGGTWKNKNNQTMTWSYDATSKTLTLSGSGKLNRAGQNDDFGLDKTLSNNESDWIPEVPWKAYYAEIVNIVIESGITSIGEQAFRKHTALETVSINGNTLTEIGKCAFYECGALETLDLTQCTSLTTIGGSNNEGPFYNSGLKKVLLSPSLTSLPPSLLCWKDSHLEEVNFSQLVNLKSIGENALKKEDSSLAIKDLGGSKLDLDKQTSLESIGKNAFRNQTGLSENLTIGSSALKTIDVGAFSAWKTQYGVLESVDLSACTRLESIGKAAFLNQKNLTSITLPNAFTWVDKDAFENTGLSLVGTSIAYCVGGNGALYNVEDDGTATKVLNQGKPTLYWVPTAAIGDDPLAPEYTLPYNGKEQALVNAPTLCPETGSYKIEYKLNEVSSGDKLPKATNAGTYTVEYSVTLPDRTTKYGTYIVTIKQKPLTESMLSLSPSSFEFDGQEHTPTLTVNDGEYPLVKDTDYEIDSTSETSKTNVGNYTIKIVGKGNYKDDASKGWRIVDTKPPVITGVVDGETYDAPVSFTATDLLLQTVTLQKDSEEPQNLPVSGGRASGSASEEGSYTLTAKDSSGNATTVHFTIKFPVVTVSANPKAGGTVSGGGSYAAGTTASVTAEANAEAGYHFVSWTENGEVKSTSTTYSFAVAGDTSLVANFELSEYKVVAGEGGVFTQASGAVLPFTIKNMYDDTMTFKRFTGIEIDGKAVPQKDSSGNANYTAKEGSVIIELQPSYLDTLAVGKHTLTGLFNDGGSASAGFTVVAAPTPVIKHIVTFDANGHGKAPAAQEVEDGKKASRPASPSASGWVFCGWYTDVDCEEAYDFSTPVTADITLYAKWTKKTSPGSGTSGKSSGKSPKVGDSFGVVVAALSITAAVALCLALVALFRRRRK